MNLTRAGVHFTAHTNTAAVPTVIFTRALRQVSGLGRTVRGPSMSCTPGKVLIDGVTEIDGEQVLSIGAIAPRGEQGLLTVPPSQLMRLRHNPFFGYVAQRTAGFCPACSQDEAKNTDTIPEK